VLTLPPSVQIFVATEPCDMRRQMDGLVLLVRQVQALWPVLDLVAQDALSRQQHHSQVPLKLASSKAAWVAH